MARIWLSCYTLVVLLVCLSEQQFEDLVAEFCDFNPNSPGCSPAVPTPSPSRPQPPPVTSRPSPVTSRPSPVTSQPDSGPPSIASCSRSSRRCPQLPRFCVPNTVSCNVLGSQEQCEVPQGISYESTVLMCGDGKSAGVRCVERGMVPILTQLIVQCKGTSHLGEKSLTKLGLVLRPGTDGGAGVYRCETAGTWKPVFQSPALDDLTESCVNTGCGRMPHPTSNMPVHRRWAWVRALYYLNQIRCTATLVSPTAAVTAAQCLTESLTSRQLLDTLDFAIELPGPTDDVPRITVQPKAFHIHPRYQPERGHKYDLAVITFTDTFDYVLPTVCLSDTLLIPSDANTQLVFKHDRGFTPRDEEPPSWRTAEATWSDSCSEFDLRIVSCPEPPLVRESQLCATHPGLAMEEGSTGSPYLAEVSNKVEEVWVLVGVLTQFFIESSCDRNLRSVYTKVADSSNWMKNCVFSGNCL